MLHKLVLFLPVALFLGCDPPPEAPPHEENANRLDQFYEQEWVQCVNDLGTERCRVIQETGLWKCFRYSNMHTSTTPATATQECAKERFDNRVPLLPDNRDRSVKGSSEPPLLPEKPTHE